MNIFLHIFESTPITYAFFLIIWIILYENKREISHKSKNRKK
jgi:hypothetical protein